MNKVKFFNSYNGSCRTQDEIDDFLKDKILIDIKLETVTLRNFPNSGCVESQTIYTVIYRDK